MTNFTTLEIITHTLGIIGCFIGALAFLLKDEKKMKLTYGLAEGTFSIHFLLLGAHAASAMTMIVAVRSFCSLSDKLKKLYLPFMGLHLGLGIWNFAEFIDSFAIIGSLIATHAFFKLSGKELRLYLIIVCLLWIIHNIVKMSYGGIVLESLYLIANFIYLYRLKKEEIKFDPA